MYLSVMTCSDAGNPLVEVEFISPTESDEKAHFEQRVREFAKDRCLNCGGIDRTRVSLIVPESAGGTYSTSNGVLLCRPCEMAAESVRQSRYHEQPRRILNFWVSRKLYNRIQAGTETKNGFNSVSALVRYLMSKYIVDEGRFDDLEQYQDAGADVKINVWVDMPSYATFKTLVDKRGITVTDAVKNLILMYLEMVVAQNGSK